MDVDKPSPLRKAFGLLSGSARRLRYRLEKGHPHLILLVGLVLLIAAIAIVGGIVVYAFGVNENLPQSMWWVFLRLSDPGYLGDDDTVASAFFGTLFTVIGMVLFMAGLVAVLTSLVVSGLRSLREGGADVAFSNHAVIIGWNSKIFSLIHELLAADAEMEIAILGDRAKEEADRELDKRVFAPLATGPRRDRLNEWRRNVVYRNGNPLVERDVQRVSLGRAARVVLLANEDDRGFSEDVRTLRKLLAVSHANRDSNMEGKKQVSVVAEITDDRVRAHAFLAAHLNPRADTWVNYYEQLKKKAGETVYLPTPSSYSTREDLTLVNDDQLIGRAIAQCAIQPFMSRVYEELLSFDGEELFLLEPLKEAPESERTAWRRILDEAAETAPHALPAYFSRHVENGLVIGVYEDEVTGAGKVFFNPAEWASRVREHPLLILGESDPHATDRARPRATPLANGEYPQTSSAADAAAPDSLRVLILGHNRRLPVIIEEFADYVSQYPNMKLDLTLVDPHLQVETIRKEMEQYQHAFKGVTEQHIRREEYSDWDVMGQLLSEGEPFDTILLVAEDSHLEGESVDARVTLGLIMLRAFRNDPKWQERLGKTTVVAEILDPQNRELADREDWVTDVIVSNEYVSRFMAQVAVDNRLEEIYRDILDYGEYEVYARSPSVYGLKTEATFLQVVEAAGARGDLALGYICATSHDGTRDIVLAPEPEHRISDAESLIVIGEG